MADAQTENPEPAITVVEEPEASPDAASDNAKTSMPAVVEKRVRIRKAPEEPPDPTLRLHAWTGGVM